DDKLMRLVGPLEAQAVDGEHRWTAAWLDFMTQIHGDVHSLGMAYTAASIQRHVPVGLERQYRECYVDHMEYERQERLWRERRLPPLEMCRGWRGDVAQFEICSLDDLELYLQQQLDSVRLCDSSRLVWRKQSALESAQDALD